METLVKPSEEAVAEAVPDAVAKAVINFTAVGPWTTFKGLVDSARVVAAKEAASTVRWKATHLKRFRWSSGFSGKEEERRSEEVEAEEEEEEDKKEFSMVLLVRLAIKGDDHDEDEVEDINWSSRYKANTALGFPA